MIVEKMVPEIYYDNSRDFAFMGRLFEIVFNYMKTAADNVGVEPSEYINSNIIDLLVNTLGFESKHEYVTKDLVYVASSFSEMLRNKGSFYAIELAIKTLLNSQRIKPRREDDLYFYDQENNELIIYLPIEMVDSILLDDLMDYILPAGVIYKFVRESGYIGSDISHNEIVVSDSQQSSQHTLTTRVHNTIDDPSVEPSDINIGTVYTGTTIDKVIGENNP